MPVKSAIVGCGYIAGIHIPYILKSKGVQLVGICDQNELRAHRLARQYDLSHYVDVARMLDETQPDAVHVLTPPQTHAALTIQALEAGCHVLVEKPLCLTLEEVDSIYAAAQEAERLVSVDHTYLWSPLVQQARRVVKSGRLGHVQHIQYVMGDDYLDAVEGGYARWARELRGGAFCDLIPHPLYLIRTFLPDVEVASARACGTSISDLRELWVNFAADGAGVSLWMSLSQRPLEHALRIYCIGGSIHVDLRNFCLAVVPERGLPGPLARFVNTLSESWQRVAALVWNMLRLPMGWFDPNADIAGGIRAFYKAISEGSQSPVNPKEARAVVELSTGIWNALEGTPGALRPAVDEKGQVISRKSPADFCKNAADEPPNVLVTGGTGFIGSHLVRRLVIDGRRVRVLCRKSSNLDALPGDGVELAFGDVSDINSVHRSMQGIKIVYHFAATTGGDWAAYYRGTVVGTRNVLQAATEAGVGKVVYVSSLGVLHASRFPNGGGVDESFPLEKRPEARGDYSRAKLEAEYVAREFAEDGKLRICIVRPGLVYGPGKAQFLPDAGFQVSNSLVLVVGLGNRQMGLTYVENLVDALLLAAQCEDSCGKTYHIVDPDQPNVRQYIRAYRDATGRRLTALYIPTFVWNAGFGLLDMLVRLVRGSSPNLGYRLRSIAHGPSFDATAAEEELGWEARVSFGESMRRRYKAEKAR